MDEYYSLCQAFEKLTEFGQPSGQYVGKMLACLKYALELEGVITISQVCAGTKSLTDEERQVFSAAWFALQKQVKQRTTMLWRTATTQRDEGSKGQDTNFT